MNLGSIFNPRRRPRPPRPQTVISRQIGKAIGALILAGGAALFGLKNTNSKSANSSRDNQPTEINQVAKDDVNYLVIKAIANNSELPFVEIKNAKVVKLLRNDNKGAKHQRWQIMINKEIILTVIYNLDLAEKVPLSVGDEIDLAGELIFGSKKHDPILHWTHADPQRKRMDGYVLLRDKKYGTLIN
jgi:hypothetical protein